MHVMVTGANGHVGRALARRLAAQGQLAGQGIERLTLLDLALPEAAGLQSAAPVVPVAGDLADPAVLQRAFDGPPCSVLFHLASIPGGLAEQQPALADRVNLGATGLLLQACRAQVEAGGPVPVFVFASSIAALGALSGPVDDHTPARPLMSYGAHKLMGEAWVAQHSRRGWVDGRSLRLAGVLARPPARTGQMSAFLSDMLRELAAGRDFVCPMSAEASTWASSWPVVVDNLLHAVTVAPEQLPPERVWNLPARCFSMAELGEALRLGRGGQPAGRLSHQPEPRIEALFGRFPPLATPAADAAGFQRDVDLPSLVRDSLRAD